MSFAYNPSLREIAESCAAKTGTDLKKGVYLGCLGPSYETPAEIRAFRILGADAVGMSTVPEVIAANHCGFKVLAFSYHKYGGRSFKTAVKRGRGADHR